MNQTKNTPLVISSRRASEKKVPLIGSSQSNIRNRTNQSLRRSGVRVRQTNNGCGQAYFFLPSPSPSPILNPSTSPLKSVFDSSQLSGSNNVQDGGTTLFLKTIHGSRSKIRLLCRLIFVWPSHAVRSNTLYASNRLIDSYRFFYESSRHLAGFPKAYLFNYYAAH